MKVNFGVLFKGTKACELIAEFNQVKQSFLEEAREQVLAERSVCLVMFSQRKQQQLVLLSERNKLLKTQLARIRGVLE